MPFLSSIKNPRLPWVTILVSFLFSLKAASQIQPEDLLIQFSGPVVEILASYNYETGEYSDNAQKNIRGYFNWAEDNGENWFLAHEIIYYGDPSPDPASVWDGKDEYGNAVATGIYLCKLKTKHFQATKKLI